MALGLPTTSSSGEFTPRVQYDARAGRLFRIDRTQTAEGWQSEQVELKFPVQMIMDLENTLVGWMRFGVGAPDFRLVPVGEPMPPKPSDDHKQGVQLRLFSPKVLGGLREWSANAKCVLTAVDSLHTQAMADLVKNPGKVPVVEWVDTMAITSGQGAQRSTNYAPVLKLVKWTDRPDALKAVETPKPSTPAAVPSTGSGHTAPPAAKTAEPTDMEPEFA